MSCELSSDDIKITRSFKLSTDLLMMANSLGFLALPTDDIKIKRSFALSTDDNKFKKGFLHYLLMIKTYQISCAIY